MKFNIKREARFITVEELLNNIPEHSLLQCVDCGRWMDIGTKGNEERKFEKEMDDQELSIVSMTLEGIRNGKGRGYSTCKYCKQKYLESSGFNWYRLAKSHKKHLTESLTMEERAEAEKRFGPVEEWECSIKKDDDGYYCCTHRARSDSYKSISKIPKSKFDFIGSTG